jgi:6-phosphofructokinase 1
MERGRTHTIVLVAEGLEFEPEENPAAKASTEETEAKPKENPAHHFARWLEKCFGNPPGKNGDVDVDIEVRPSVLGHLQRGGRPAPADAILAARFADAAWEALVDPKISGGVVVLRSNECTTVSFEEIDRDPKRGNWQKRQALQKALSGW